MLAHVVARCDPGDVGEVSAECGAIEGGEVLDIAELAVLLDRVEIGQRVPDPRRARVLLNGPAGNRSLGAIGLNAAGHVVAPADAGAVKQVGEVGPWEVSARVVIRVRRVVERVDAARGKTRN